MPSPRTNTQARLGEAPLQTFHPEGTQPLPDLLIAKGNQARDDPVLSRFPSLERCQADIPPLQFRIESEFLLTCRSARASKAILPRSLCLFPCLLAPFGQPTGRNGAGQTAMTFPARRANSNDGPQTGRLWFGRHPLFWSRRLRKLTRRKVGSISRTAAKKTVGLIRSTPGGGYASAIRTFCSAMAWR
jgi:hypothetical protein